MTHTRMYLTTGDVAELCGVTPETVRRWIRLGQLRPVRIPGQFRFRREDVLPLLEPAPRPKRTGQPAA